MQYQEFLKTKLRDVIPSDVQIPQGFHLVGHVVLLQLDENLMDYAELIGNTTLEYDSRIRSVAVRIGPTIARMRNPQYQVVAGDSDTVTLHVERGVKFCLDPLRVTFSGGNRTERMRISDIVRPGEVVLDMFACVGQFTLHIAKMNKTRVIAVEINPVAYDFLIKNIELNSLSNNVNTILGDCRKVSPTNIANRIVMGYLHNTIHYLPYAIRALHQDGGTIHMHLATQKQDLIHIRNTINTYSKEAGFLADIVSKRVKHYSPNVEHLVFDISLSPT